MATETKQMTSTIVSGLELNASSDILYTKPKLNGAGGKSVGILNASSKKAFYVSTPLMLTWGFNENDFDGSGKKSYDMSLQFPSADYANADCTKFLENMRALEAQFKADAIKNSKEWMNKAKLSPEVVDALWSPMLKYPKDKDTGEFDYNRAPTLRIKIPFWDGAFSSEVYDVDKNSLFPNKDGIGLGDLITKGINVAAIIQCGGFWFANGKFGVTWKLLQCIVKPKQSLRGVCHLNISADDKKKLTADEDEGDDEVDEKPANIVDDSESEAEEEPEPEPEEEPEPEPAPAPAPKKRVVKKKA